MPKYLSRPRLITAVQFDPGNRPWPSNVYERGMPGTKEHNYYVFNVLHNSPITLKPGDFVRVDDPSDNYPIDAEIFNKTYDEVGDTYTIEGDDNANETAVRT